MLGLLLGLIAGTFLYYRMAELGKNLRKIAPEDKIAATVGTTVSLVLAYAFGAAIWRWQGEVIVRLALVILESVVIVWVFNMITSSMKDEIRFLIPGFAQRAAAAQPTRYRTSTVRFRNYSIPM